AVPGLFLAWYRHRRRRNARGPAIGPVGPHDQGMAAGQGGMALDLIGDPVAAVVPVGRRSVRVVLRAVAVAAIIAVATIAIAWAVLALSLWDVLALSFLLTYFPVWLFGFWAATRSVWEGKWRPLQRLLNRDSEPFSKLGLLVLGGLMLLVWR